MISDGVSFTLTAVFYLLYDFNVYSMLFEVNVYSIFLVCLFALRDIACSSTCWKARVVLKFRIVRYCLISVWPTRTHIWETYVNIPFNIFFLFSRLRNTLVHNTLPTENIDCHWVSVFWSCQASKQIEKQQVPTNNTIACSLLLNPFKQIYHLRAPRGHRPTCPRGLA